VLGYAVVRPKGRSKSLDLEHWRWIIKTTSFLRRAPPMQGINPFTKQLIFIPKRDSAQVVVDGRVFGELAWVDGCLYLDGPSEVLTPIACQIAQALNATVKDEDGRPLTAPSGWTLEAAILELQREKAAAKPAGKKVLVLKYPGRFRRAERALFVSGEKLLDVARRVGLPSRERAKRMREQYDHYRHTFGSLETEEIHRFEDQDGWVHELCVVDGVIKSSGRGPPEKLLRKLGRSRRKS
jgi:hypothetical protein